MKLLIEISEPEYELIVGDEACGLNPLTRAVANGQVIKPIEEKMLTAKMSTWLTDGLTEREVRRAIAIAKARAKIRRKYDLLAKRIKMWGSEEETEDNDKWKDAIEQMKNEIAFHCDNIGSARIHSSDVFNIIDKYTKGLIK